MTHTHPTGTIPPPVSGTGTPHASGAASRAERITTISTVVGSLATFGALLFTGMSLHYLSDQTKYAAEQAAATRRQVQLAQEQNVSAITGQAIEQLDSDKMGIRILGINTLGRVIKPSSADQAAVLHGLAGFLREQRHIPNVGSPQSMEKTCETAATSQVQADTQAGLTLMKRLGNPIDDSHLDLSRSCLTGANLQDARLSGINMEFSRLAYSNLKGADLNNSNLSSAWFFDADLRNADLSGENSDFTATEFRHTDLRKANLSNAPYAAANFDDAKMEGTNLKGADLSLAENLTVKQLNSAVIDSRTKLPDYMKGKVRIDQ
ncbi:pentapeptide repeat-containing protein [Streptomyces sp. NPDC059718]